MPSAPQAGSSSDFPDDPFSETSKAASSPYLPRNDHISASNSNDSLAAWAKTTRFNVLNHFSQVTNVARNGAHTLLSSPLFQAFDPNLAPDDDGDDGMHGIDGRKRNQRSSVASLATSFLQHGPVGPFGPSDPSWKHSELAKKSGTGEYDSARVYLAKWAKLVAEEGELNRAKEREETRRRAAAAAQSSSSTSASVGQTENSEVGVFEIWDLLPCIDKPESTRAKASRISEQAWSALFDDDGRPTVSFNHMRQLVFQYGFGREESTASSSATTVEWQQLGPRAECWSFLLGAQTWSMKGSANDRMVNWKKKVLDYSNLHRERAQGEKSEQDAAFWKEQKHRVRVDCLRVDKKLPLFREGTLGQVTKASDRSHLNDEGDDVVSVHIQRLQNILLAYVSWNRKEEAGSVISLSGEEAGLLGGYVQGMSDLCAPLFSLCQGDEAKTFWLFVGLMTKMRSNFYTDQSGMKMQLLCLQKLINVMDPNLYNHLEKAESLNLFFCFRWLLICFKREFQYSDILLLWEAIWAASFEEEGEDGKSNEEKDEAGPSSSTSFRGLSSHFQLFVAFAILEHHRDIQIKYLHNFDELLQYMNGLSYQIDVECTIAEAEVLCLSLKALIEQKQQKKTEALALPNIDDDLVMLVNASSVPSS